MSEAKTKLEKMAKDYSLGEVDTCHYVDYIAGFRAARDMAVRKAEELEKSAYMHGEGDFIADKLRHLGEEPTDNLRLKITGSKHEDCDCTECLPWTT